MRSATAVERLLATRIPLGTALFRRWLTGLLANSTGCLRLDLADCAAERAVHQPMSESGLGGLPLQELLDLGYIVSIEPNGPDRMVVLHQVARGDQAACQMLPENRFRGDVMSQTGVTARHNRQSRSPGRVRDARSGGTLHA